jgi:hypothetical protein
MAEHASLRRGSQCDASRTRQRIAELRGGTPLPPDAVAWARLALGVDTPAEWPVVTKRPDVVEALSADVRTETIP